MVNLDELREITKDLADDIDSGNYASRYVRLSCLILKYIDQPAAIVKEDYSVFYHNSEWSEWFKEVEGVNCFEGIDKESVCENCNLEKALDKDKVIISVDKIDGIIVEKTFIPIKNNGDSGAIVMFKPLE